MRNQFPLLPIPAQTVIARPSPGPSPALAWALGAGFCGPRVKPW